MLDLARNLRLDATPERERANGSASVPVRLQPADGDAVLVAREERRQLDVELVVLRHALFTIDTDAAERDRTAAAAGAGAGFQCYDGAAKTLWLNADQTGTFSLHATASDPQSGIARSASRRSSAPARTTTRRTRTTRRRIRSTARARRSVRPGASTVTATNGVTAAHRERPVTISADGAAPARFSLGVARRWLEGRYRHHRLGCAYRRRVGPPPGRLPLLRCERRPVRPVDPDRRRRPPGRRHLLGQLEHDRAHRRPSATRSTPSRPTTSATRRRSSFNTVPSTTARRSSRWLRPLP